MKIRVKFAKYGPVRFIGHLDVMRYFQKAVRRAELPVSYSGGYSPHQIMSFAYPLSVGYTSEGEYFDLALDSSMDTEIIKNKLQSVMVYGIDVLAVQELSDNATNAMASVAAATYYITFKNKCNLNNDFYTLMEKYLDQPHINVVKETKKSEKTIDIKDYLFHYSFPICKINNVDEEEKIRCLMTTDASSSGNLKPSFIIESFCKNKGIELPEFAYSIHRIETLQRVDNQLVPLIYE